MFLRPTKQRNYKSFKNYITNTKILIELVKTCQCNERWELSACLLKGNLGDSLNDRLIKTKSRTVRTM